jgi:hypothetical protein
MAQVTNNSDSAQANSEASMPLDKTQVARRQLGMALALFIEDLDPISVHTLACAGGEIAEHLARKKGKQPFAEHILATFPDFDIARIRKVQKQYCNAFKHATTQKGKERDDADLFVKFDDTVNEHSLFVGWFDYHRAAAMLPLEAQVFHVWYLCVYPERLEPGFDVAPLEAVFPDLRSKTRSAQKKALRGVIEHYRHDRELMTDPATDPTPLVL